MSHRVEITNDKTGEKIVIPVIMVDEPDKICTECGNNDDCRPYGHKGAQVCYECAQKNPARTKHNMAIQLFGDKGELQ